MTATGHAIIGVVIAAKITNPYISVPAAILSHVAADAFPHWDVGTNAKKKQRTRLYRDTFFDVFGSFVTSYLLLYFLFPHTNVFYAFILVLFSQGFDWFTGPYYFLNMKIPPFTWAYKFQKLFDNRLDKPWGIITQVAALLSLIVLAKVI